MKRSLIGLVCSAALTASAAAQTSDYFIVDGGSNTISVVQEQAVNRSWSARSNAMPIAVGSTVRTYVQYAGGDGSEYTLGGTWTGVDYPHQGESNQGQNVDGASDGAERNWLAGFADGAIWEYDSSWQNPIRLFDTAGPTGVTYDGTTGHLWVIEFSNQRIAEFTLGGQEISSFSYSSPSSWLGALAWEPASDTLWAEEFSTGTIYQYDKTGNVLQSFVLPELAGYAWGGEFAIPEPASLLLVSVGLAALLRRRG